MDDMMICERREEFPATYPDTPEGLLSDKAAALDDVLIWDRIESYIAHRWTEREVVWIVLGPGEFVPDLKPATITAQEVWSATGYVATSLDPSPLGGVMLPGDGHYRFTATVGGGTVPAGVWEAFRRLAEYYAERPRHQGAGRVTNETGPLKTDFDRTPKWVAMAMQLSGAADLLRQYRRA